MNDSDPLRPTEPPQTANTLDMPMHRLSPNTDNNNRIAELEFENLRLHRLVAELLLKNEKLRKPD